MWFHPGSPGCLFPSRTWWWQRHQISSILQLDHTYRASCCQPYFISGYLTGWQHASMTDCCLGQEGGLAFVCLHSLKGLRTQQQLDMAAISAKHKCSNWLRVQCVKIPGDTFFITPYSNNGVTLRGKLIAFGYHPGLSILIRTHFSRDMVRNCIISQMAQY